MADDTLNLWITPSGPNPWKVFVVLEELQLPYKLTVIRFEDTKFEPFIKLNPNGRVPALQDPKTGINLWESGAIIQYLIEQYDDKHVLSYETLAQRHLCNQWLMFQMSGQGPYFGQASWFNVLHHEKVPSAIERYTAEVRRILGVLETSLAGKDWLVGDKMTYADLAFVHWLYFADLAMGTPGQNPVENFTGVKAWYERMMARPSMQKSLLLRQKYMGEQGLLANTGLPKDVTLQDVLEKIDKEKSST